MEKMSEKEAQELNQRDWRVAAKIADEIAHCRAEIASMAAESEMYVEGCECDAPCGCGRVFADDIQERHAMIASLRERVEAGQAEKLQTGASGLPC